MRRPFLHTSTLGRFQLVAVVLAFLFAGGQAFGQPSGESPPADGPPPHHRGGPPGEPPGGGLDQALEQIDLPDDVRTDVDALLDEARTERRAFHRSLKAAQKDMRAKLEADEPDEAAVLAQADEIGRLRTEVEKTRLRTLLRINKRLSPEQREALTELLKKHRRGRGKRERPQR